MTWFWFSIVALLCWSGSDFFSKIGCRDGRDKYSQFKMVMAVGAVMGIHALYEIFVGGVEIYLPLKGLIDVEKETARLTKEREKLQKEIGKLPPEYELRQIDADLYDQCLESPVTADFVSAFESKEQYLQMGRGMVILKDGKIVSGASSYARYNEGIEIEVDTIKPERRKHLATIVCSALILSCLDECLYPSWDTQNIHSVCLAEKLGYEFDHTYTAYEVAAEARIH